MKTDFTFFWNGPFSQWFTSKFKIDGVEYNCCEQYMMAQKALLFEDHEAYNKIMDSYDAREQKEFGRGVKGFVEEIWNAHCKDIVFKGNYAKFSQNGELYRKLMNTIGTELVEASPKDAIWGIGLKEDDPRAWDKSTWQGTNWLGETLTAVRDTFVMENMPQSL